MRGARHPEIELGAAHLSGNPIATVTGKPTVPDIPRVDLLEVWPDGKVRIDEDTVVDDLPVSVERASEDHGPLRIIFVTDPNYGYSSSYSSSVSCGEKGLEQHGGLLNNTAMWFHHHLGVSLVYFQHVGPTVDFQVPGNGLFTRFDESSGEVVAIDGFYCNSGLRIALSPLIWFSHSVLKPHESIYLVYNCSQQAKDRIFACAATQPSALLRPLAIDTFLLEVHLAGWIDIVTGLRRTLVYYEHTSGNDSAQNTKAIETLHTLSQDFHRARDNLVDLKTKVQFLSEIRQYYLDLSSKHFTPPIQDLRTVEDSLALIASRGDSASRWASGYKERTAIRINFFFNLITQADSRTNLSIARLTSRISVAAQRDSSSMITIAVVTMFFLPGSFVSALFSMVFFNSEKDANGTTNLTISPQWWLFPITAIPLTLLVLGLWVVWRERRCNVPAQDDSC